MSPIRVTEGERRRQRRRRADKLWRRAVYAAAIALIVYAGYLAWRSDTHATRADQHASQAIRQVQNGRAVSITITCAVLSSISEAGKAVIAGSPKPPPAAEERAFEALGFPPFEVRHAQQATAGELYVEAIARKVNQELAQVGKRPIPGLIRKNGTIDCRVLQRVSAVPQPR